MKWFGGTITEAINTAKTQLAVIVVYVEGDDEVSKTMTEVLDKASITGLLSNGKFVSIKLAKDSEPYKQFAAIYQFVPVPSLFFIQAGTGVPIEIIAGSTNIGLEEKIIAAIQKCDVAPATASDATVETKNKEETANNPSELSREEKIEKAKQLVIEKNKEKQLQLQEEEKAKEKERRKMGQEMLKAKQKKQDLELIQMKQEIEKARKEEADAKKKVLEQIALDKAERQKKQQPVEKPVTPSASQAPKPFSSSPSSSSANSNTARLQFKLPSGEAITASFPADTTLAEVRNYVNETIKPPFKEYQLATMFPRREFTAKESSFDLRRLDLLPSAVILILPSFGSVQAAGPGWTEVFSKMFWDFLQPVFTISRYVQGYIFGHGNGAPREDTNDTTNTTRRNIPSGSRVRRRGNFATLGDNADDSDENNTWNGNSTQQM